MNILEIQNALLKINWAEVISSLSNLAIAILAYMALHTWKKQDKTNREADFLNELSRDVHECILVLKSMPDMLGYIEMGVQAKAYPVKIDVGNISNRDFINYILNAGTRACVKLDEKLNECKPLLANVSSLVTRGQIFDFPNYKACQNSCQILIKHYEFFIFLSLTLKMTDLDWENDEVQNKISNIRKIDKDLMKKEMDSANINFLEFTKGCYQSFYR